MQNVIHILFSGRNLDTFKPGNLARTVCASAQRVHRRRGWSGIEHPLITEERWGGKENRSRHYTQHTGSGLAGPAPGFWNSPPSSSDEVKLIVRDKPVQWWFLFSVSLFNFFTIKSPLPRMDATAVRAKLGQLSGSPGTIETLSMYFGHWKSNATMVRASTCRASATLKPKTSVPLRNEYA